MTNIEITSSASISTSNANSQGGSFYASSTNNSYYMTGSTITSSTATNNGGICAFTGLENYVYLSGCSLTTLTSQADGGSFYMGGTNLA